ncbi:MAG: beta-lactamase family protein [Haliscomenobacter sp.]|nr:beta-lactamase family protein [Haliscomenobacter sp.]
MTHTSGLTEYFELWEKHAPQDRIFSNHDLLKMYQNLKPPLDFEPGAEFRYSNTGYLMLALVMEAVAGMPAESFILDRIIKPLGLKATFPYHLGMPSYPHPDRVLGFEWKNGKAELADLYNIDGVFGDGNMYASAPDLQKWSQALRSISW